MTVATCNPQNLSVLDEMRTFLGFDIEMVVATEPDIAKSLERYYSVAAESFESVVTDLADDRELTAAAQAVAGEGAIDLTSLEAVASPTPGTSCRARISVAAKRRRDPPQTERSRSATWNAFPAAPPLPTRTARSSRMDKYRPPTLLIRSRGRSAGLHDRMGSEDSIAQDR